MRFPPAGQERVAESEIVRLSLRFRVFSGMVPVCHSLIDPYQDHQGPGLRYGIYGLLFWATYFYQVNFRFYFSSE